ncbi:hypothetical protein BDZ94DRAFT_1262924 [Collybia nuda]|uniref:Secreted protein n=1 Tax=Collybia nuda TaxID=64659 RepID=A0A9P6CDG3_9AGAR|nr:hypothetical protein BDZ94DRAFT_1262924 [Collybia nuda]
MADWLVSVQLAALMFDITVSVVSRGRVPNLQRLSTFTLIFNTPPLLHIQRPKNGNPIPNGLNLYLNSGPRQAPGHV